MTIAEQHIAVELAFQKIGASQWDNLQSQEIDFALNVAQERFVKKSFESKNASFSDNQRHLDDIQVLLVKNKELRTYLPTYATEPNVVVAELPVDYLFLVNDRSRIASAKLKGCVVKPEVVIKPELVQVGIIPFKYYASDYPYYTKITFQLDHQEVNSPGNLYTEILFESTNSYYASGIDLSEQFELMRAVLEALNRNKLGVVFYWERYNQTYESNSFIGVYVGDAVALQMQVETDNVLNVRSFDNTYRQVYKSDVGTSVVPNRVISADNLYRVLRHPFAKSTSTSPVSTISDNKLFLYEGSSFIVTGAVVDYIRKPSRLSKLENLSCELAPHTHQEINDLAVEYLQLSTTNPSYQAKVSDDLNRGEN